MYDLVLIGGGRSKKDKTMSIKALDGVKCVLNERLNILKIWIDEHGGFWYGEKFDKPCVLTRNMVVDLCSDEMIIGGDEISFKSQKIWSLISGFDYGSIGINGFLEFNGFDFIGNRSEIVQVTNNDFLAKIVFGDLDFYDNKNLLVKRDDWMSDYLKVEEKINSKIQFPVMIKNGSFVEKVSLMENFSNVVFSIFEKEGFNEILVEQYDALVEDAIVAFVGGKNFLPSKMCLIKNDALKFESMAQSERMVQNLLIKFVKKYDVSDFGLLFFKKKNEVLKLFKIDLLPDFSKEGLFARLWEKSGIEYNRLIEKIYWDSLNENIDPKSNVG